MSGLSIRSLRQLAIGGSQAIRPLASMNSTMASSPARAASTATVQAQRLPKPKRPAVIPPKKTKPAVVPYRRWKQPRPDLAKFPEGHGEQIWVYNNIVTHQVVYSHSPVLRNNRALKQLAFNGKKTKPAKLRKDYWRPMALIQFNEGEGVIGRSVYQRLREFRHVHELSWGHQEDEFYSLDRKALGEALSDQRANSIADIAAVLSGEGTGNRIQQRIAGTGGAEDTFKLADAIVFWANDQDRTLAEKWTKNVRHAVGLPSLTRSKAEIQEEAAEIEAPAAEAA